MNLITAARITELPKTWSDPMPRVYVTLDGEEVFLFEYYSDEISFTPDEFLGLNAEQACSLKGAKDRAYLRSAP